MSKLNRVTAKIFGETASTTNTPKEIGQFGSGKLGTYNATGDIATIQNLPAWSNGWIDAVTPNDQFPPLPEMTGVHKVLSYQNAYLMQQGMPEWDSSTDYYINNFCSYEGIIYKSLIDNNTNIQPGTDETAWEEYNSQPPIEWANKDLNNLTSFGNARLQYAPFSINAGTLDSNGENATIHTNSELVYRKRDIVTDGTLTITNNTIVSGFSASPLTRFGSTYNIDFAGLQEGNDTFEFQTDFITGTVNTNQYITGGYTENNDPIMINITSGGKLRVSLEHTSGSPSSGDIAAKHTIIANSVQANTRYLVRIVWECATGDWKFYLNNQLAGSTNYSFSTITTDRMGFGGEHYISSGASRLRAVFTGSVNLANTSIKINDAFVWQGVANATSSDYQWTESAGTSLICDPCIVTTCDGRTINVNNTNQTDVSSLSDNSYYIYRDCKTGELELATTLYLQKVAPVSLSITDWTNPLLSSDGTWGGDSFAVRTDQTPGHGSVYQLFDGSSTTYVRWIAHPNIDCYNPNPMQIEEAIVTVHNEAASGYPPAYVIMYGTNDLETFVELGRAETRNGSNGSSFTITPTNESFFKYIRFYLEPSSHSGSYAQATLKEIKLKGKVVTGIDTSTPVYWLDMSTVPTKFKKIQNQTITDINDLVYIGKVDVASGIVSSIENNLINNNFTVELPNIHIVKEYTQSSTIIRIWSNKLVEQWRLNYTQATAGAYSITYPISYAGDPRLFVDYHLAATATTSTTVRNYGYNRTSGGFEVYLAANAMINYYAVGYMA